MGQAMFHRKSIDRSKVKGNRNAGASVSIGASLASHRWGRRRTNAKEDEMCVCVSLKMGTPKTKI